MNPITRVDSGTLPEIELQAVSKRFGDKYALDGVRFAAQASSLTVVLGAAGAGKTTMLRIIAGLERPDSGHVLIAGRYADRLETKDRDVAMIFDNLALYPNKTGFENIASSMRIAGRDQAYIERRVQDTAGKLKIGHVLRRLPKTMSGGERQRVALGRALVREPKLFLLDEPLSSLDAMLRIELRAELRRLQRELGYTFLLATPDFAEAMAIADTIVFLREGRIVQIADPLTLYSQPVDCEVARFVGSPEINLLPSRFTPDEGGHILIDEVLIPAPPVIRRRDYCDAFDFIAGLRPEHLRLQKVGEGTWQGTVTDVEPLGLKAAITVALGHVEVRVLVAANDAQELVLGQPTGVSFNEEKLLVFDSETKTRLP